MFKNNYNKGRINNEDNYYKNIVNNKYTFNLKNVFIHENITNITFLMNKNI